jgi:RHS repeat-associated protein
MATTASPVYAQTVNLGDDVARPMPGKGHDYIHGLSETVNPANGTVSIKIDLPVPQGRGITLPFAITYNSGEVYRFSSLLPGCGAFGPTSFCSNPGLQTNIGGWSNTLPYATYSNIQSNLPPYTNGNTYCNMTSSYNFYDPTGASHMLGLAGISSSPLGTGASQGGTGSETASACAGATYSPTQCAYQAEDGFTACTGGFTYDAVASAGDGEVAAKSDHCTGYTVTGYPPLPADCQYGDPSFTVTDPHGTVYSFPSMSGPDGSGTLAEYPQTIEDRNGNILTMNLSQVNSGLSGPVTLTDTLGRVVVSIADGSGGYPSSYTVGGLEFNPTWETATTTATFSSPDAAQIDVPPSSGNGYDIVPCTASFAVQNATVTGMSTLSLPNGQSYTFKYDPEWGLVNEIDYPDGGWVKYTWKMSDTNSELATFNAKQSNTGFPPLTGYCNYRYQTPVVATRTVGNSKGSAASLTQTFTYKTVWNPTTSSWNLPSSNVSVGDERTWTSKTTTVSTVNTLPSGTTETSQTVYQYGSVLQSLQPDSQGQMPAQLAVESQVAYSDWGTTTPLKTEYKAWYDQFDMAADTTILSNGLGTQAIYCLVSGDSYDLIQEEDQYNTLTSRTVYAQSTTGTATSLPSSCSPSTAPKSTVYGYYTTFGLPNQVVTYAAGTRIAETDAYYDGFSVLNPPYNTNTVPATPPAATPVGSKVTISSSIHDETNYGASSTIMRGNPTKVVRWASSGTSPTTTYTYDQTGQVRSKTDACGNSNCSDMTGTSHKTTYSYADAFTELSGGSNVSYSSALSTDAYLTLITDPLSHTASFQYDYKSGQLTSSTDANGQITNYIYNDSLNRLTSTLLPDGGQTTVSFEDSVPSITTSELLSTGGPSKVTITTMDGMGHVTNTDLSTAPEGPHLGKVNYDGMGLPNQTWNTYVSTSDTTYGISVHTYDALGRKVQLQNQDGTSSSWCYSASRSGCPGVLATGYSPSYPPVTWVDSYDELGNHHQDVSDGFGRLIAVMEPNGASAAPSMETDYTYDLLNNLLAVQQWGGAPNSSGARSRSFTYDSLSRLVCSSNPENSYVSCPASASTSHVSGTTSYSYDANGNLASKTDARGITTSYTYDALNRVLAKSYSDGTNSACYRYDVAAKTGTTQNLIGQLTAEWTQAGSCPASTATQIPSTVATAQAYMTYDPMGRLQSQWYCTPQDCNYSNKVSATYDLLGDTTAITYPDGRVVSQGFDGAARLSSVNSSWSGTSTPYLGVNTYDAFDHPISWTMDSGSVATTATSAYNKRVELTSLGYAQSAGKLWGKSYAWTSNANLLSTTDSISGVVRQFGYDTLDRLTSAQDLKGTSSGNGQTTNSSDQAQTNVLEDSQTLGSSGWSAQNATLTPNSVVAPDGTMTAGSIVSTTGNDTWVTDSTATPALYDGENLSGTIWLRTPSSTPIMTSIYIVGVTNTGINNGPINNFIGPTSVKLTQAWQQFQVSGTVPNGMSALLLQVGGAGTITSGEEVDVWGAQLQQISPGASVTNILPYSQQWDTLSWGSLSVGQVVADNATNSLFTAPDGTKTGFQVTASSGSADTYVIDIAQNPAQYDNATVTGSVYLRVPSGTQNINLYMVYKVSSSANIIASETVTLNTSWQRFQLSGTAGTNLNGLYLQVGGGGSITSSEVFDVWGAQMEVAPSANQYVATLDYPVTVTADSTNILPSSTQVGGPGWYVYSGTVAANSAIAPDGTTTADTLTSTVTSGPSTTVLDDTVSNPSLYDGATLTGSIYLKAQAAQTLTVLIQVSTASGGTTLTNVEEPVTTTWQRFDLPSVTAPNGLTSIDLKLGSSSNSEIVYTNPIYIWGAQMVMGSSAGTVTETNNTTTGTGGSTLAADGLNESYSYDAFGNMLSAGNYNFVQSYTTSNQLSGWNYDASGNLLIDSFNNGYAYDAEGRVSGEGQYVVASPTYTFHPATTYVYDAGGSRVAKTGSSAIDYIEFGGRQLARLSGGQWTDLIYGVGGLLAEVPGTQAGTPVYRMIDHLGSVAGTLDSSGNLLSSLDYAPFGQIFAGGTADPYVFTGKERDAESGNDYFGARYYASSMGRFLSPDRFFFQKEMLEDPQRFNLYSYARNNPLVMIDPSGEAIQLSNDADQRAAQMSALCGVVGSTGCSYLYANAVTSTDKDGNQQTNYYLGILSGGPSGSGSSFSDLNAPAAALGGIVGDPRVAQLSLVAPGTVVGNPGDQATIGFAPKNTPGATFQTPDGQWHIDLVDPGKGRSPGVLPGAYMSDGDASRLTMGMVTGHELGHLQYGWSSKMSQAFQELMHPQLGGSNASALKLENQVRQLKDPAAPTRIEH